MRFLSIFSRIIETYQSRHEPESARGLSRMIWRAALAAAFGVASIGIWNGGVAFSDASAAVSRRNSADVPTTDRTAANRAALDRVLAAFDARAARVEELKTNSSSPADPSR